MKKILAFVIPALLLGWLIQVIAILSGIKPESPNFNMIASFVMWTPAIVAIALRIIKKEKFSYSLSMKWRKLHYLLLAVIIPFILVQVMLFIQNFIGLTEHQLFEYNNGFMNIIGDYAMLFGVEPQPILFFILNFILTIIVASILGLYLTLGEEIGWRAFLQGRLIKQFGCIKGIILLGIIWSLWHMPFVLIGFNFPHSPVLGAFVFFPVNCIALSVFLWWITIKSKSALPAGIMHASVNLFFNNTTIGITSSPILVYIFISFFPLLLSLPFAYSIYKMYKNEEVQSGSVSVSTLTGIDGMSKS